MIVVRAAHIGWVKPIVIKTPYLLRFSAARGDGDTRRNHSQLDRQLRSMTRSERSA
jgi:hypothetical protein